MNFTIHSYVTLVIVMVSLKFQIIVKPHIRSSTSYTFWLPAWWALRLPWWPLANCSDASMGSIDIYRVFCSCFSFFLYSVGNKTYYFYYYCYCYCYYYYYYCYCCHYHYYNYTIYLVALFAENTRLSLKNRQHSAMQVSPFINKYVHDSETKLNIIKLSNIVVFNTHSLSISLSSISLSFSSLSPSLSLSYIYIYQHDNHDINKSTAWCN